MTRRQLAVLLLAGAGATGGSARAEPRVRVDAAGARISDGERVLPVAPVLLVEDGAPPGSARPAAARRRPFAWRACGEGCAAAELTDGPLLVTLRLQRAATDGAVTLAAHAEWRAPAWVHRVALELALPGAPRVIGRDLRTTTAPLAYLGRFDPKWITAGAVTLIADDGVDGVVVRTAAPDTVVTVELDAAEARPFLHDARCTLKWRAPNRHLPAPSRLRAAGDQTDARLQLLFDVPAPLVKAALPDGRRAALVITDHADQSTTRTLAALARGFIAHHLVLTKALFAHGDDRPQLEDPAMVAVADELYAAGSEIVPHSATPRPDDRSVTAAGMDRFDRWHARTWIDHQPETNCEAFGDEGYQAGGRYGIADLLVAHHYEYVWAEDDTLPLDLNLLAPARLGERAPTVWPLGRLAPASPGGLWMFRTMWAFVEAHRFYALYDAAALDRLERERGLHIAHTYLETYHKRGTLFGTRNLLVPADKSGTPGGPGAVQLDPRFGALLAALEARQARGSLWVATLAALGDRLRAVAAVTVTRAADGSWRVHSAQPLAGATFVVPHAAEARLDGHPPRGARRDGDELTFWDDLPAGDTTVSLR